MLSASIEQFLHPVCRVAELENWDAELTTNGRMLWARLARAEDQGCTEAFAESLRALAHVGAMRRSIASELSALRVQGMLQVLGR